MTDPLLAGRSDPVNSCTLPRLVFLCAGLLGAVEPLTGPKLDPLPLAALGGGEDIRIGGASTLAARRTDLVGVGDCRFLGIAGTGGASLRSGPCGPRLGEGSRKVRSDMEPELPLRSSCDAGLLPPLPATELPMEEADSLLRIVRFVWTSATDIGVVGRDRNAAPAAAAARDALDCWFFRNAWAAAVVALKLVFATLLLNVCRESRVS